MQHVLHSNVLQAILYSRNIRTNYRANLVITVEDIVVMLATPVRVVILSGTVLHAVTISALHALEMPLDILLHLLVLPCII